MVIYVLQYYYSTKVLMPPMLRVLFFFIQYSTRLKKNFTYASVNIT